MVVIGESGGNQQRDDVENIALYDRNRRMRSENVDKVCAAGSTRETEEGLNDVWNKG